LLLSVIYLPHHHEPTEQSQPGDAERLAGGDDKEQTCAADPELGRRDRFSTEKLYLHS
jgi:hypothetical protein